MMGNFANAITLDTGSVINGTLNLGPSIAATLTLDGTGTQLYSTAVTGATTLNGALIKNGTGTWTLDESFTYTGGTTINAGTLNVRADNNLGAASGGLTFDGGTLQWGASFSLSATRAIALEVVGGAFDTDGFNTTIAQGITGSGDLTKAGAGTLTLMGINTYAGGTTISAGTLQLGNGGTSGSINGNVIDNGTLAFDRSDAVTFAGAISGAGSVTQIGTGTTILTGTNTYGGGTTISSGTLQIGNGVTNGSIVGDVTDNGTLAFDQVGSVPFAGAISRTGTVEQIGSGILRLTGNNTYSGATTVSSGTLQAGSATAFSANSAFNVMGLSVLDLNGFDVSIGSLAGVAGATVSLGVHTLTAGGNNASTTYAGLITGTGGLTKVGSGTLTLSGTSTYTGPTNINAGVLVGGALNSLSSLSAFVIANAASLDISSADQTIGSLAGAGGATVNLGTHILTTGGNNTSTTYAGLITGSGGLTKVGLGTLTLSGTSIYSGATNINAGVLAGGAPNSLSRFSAFAIANAAVLDISAADQTIGSLAGVAGATVNLGAHSLTTGGDNTSTLFAGTISGSGGGALVKIGSGIFTIAGTNTYSSGTTISAGTLQIGNGGTTGSITGNVTDNGTLVFNRSDAMTFDGVISGTGSLVQLGSDTLTLTGNNTYSGNTTISAGTLQIGNGGTSGSVSGNVTDNGTVAFDRSDSVTFAGVIKGTGNLVQLGSGTLVLNGNNSYSGGTTISAGTLQIGNGGTTGSIIGNVIDNAALVFDRRDTVTFGGIVSGAGKLVQLGTGNVILAGNNNYTGGTQINAGTLQIGNGGTGGSIDGNVTDNATFAFDRSDSVTFGGVISGTGALVQMGSGTLTLTGDNSYGGGTAINARATLQLGNGATTGSIIGNVTDDGR
jgi:fibronectin-binding autotransporter adhesin